ncbi:MAG: cold-shock protein [Acidimicrobiales bacterium]|jgi:cold shock CspA family protein
MATRPPRRGTVTEFDPDVGLGVIVASGDGPEYHFHLAAIADRTREIEVGAEVVFDVAAGPDGRYEATAIVKL